MVLVTPLLLLLVFGIVDFGFMFQRYVVLTNAAAEGARVGILPNYTTADAEARATSYAETGGIPTGQVTAVASAVTLTGGSGTWPGMEVTVSHLYTWHYIGVVARVFGGNFTSVQLTARSTMRRQLSS